MRRVLAPATALVAGALLMTGCGGGKADAERVVRTANAFDRAIRARDYERGCALLTAKSREAVTKARSVEPSDCPSALYSLDERDPEMPELRPFAKDDVELDGDHATVSARYWREAAGKLRREQGRRGIVVGRS